ncbi:prefoldin domain-containing protein [Mucilaginibacter boryungensis]|uniref:Endosialidase-like protein n=1 Tax=Mucilaginibacter boryungensis TaxID=768480 RepID=A0ABR9XLK3_9SPHI|nr:hypothetical protein [Mucilaginibacter boryungensis]MBE9668262.1 hypothetical protein [Mucilaginibacter boryungensis]
MKRFFTLFAMFIAIHSYAQFSTTSGITATTDPVGIGTTSLPTEGKLQVNGLIDNIAVNNYGAFRIYNGSNFPGGIGTDSWAHGGSSADFTVYGSHNLYLTAGDQKRMTLLSSGNVGIGTTSPLATLDVGKTLASGELASVLARLNEGNTSGSGTYLGIRGYDTQPNTTYPNLNDVKSFAIEHSFYGMTNSSINFLRGGGMTGGSISFSTNSNIERMRIDGNGKVGIGTTTPDELLSVNGTIHSKEVKVNLTGLPDYVFKPEYHLPTLAEVKSYIDKNSHLPEIPSAQEVEKNGLNLGEMNKLLLKKVEELTLYLIDKDKQIDELQLKQKITEKQQNQIEELNRKLEVLINKTSKTTK